MEIRKRQRYKNKKKNEKILHSLLDPVLPTDKKEKCLILLFFFKLTNLDKLLLGIYSKDFYI